MLRVQTDSGAGNSPFYLGTSYKHILTGTYNMVLENLFSLKTIKKSN